MAYKDSKKNPFHSFHPIQWMLPSGEHVFSVKRDHGVKGTFHLHNPRDQINQGRKYLQKVIIEYRIGRNKYDLFTIEDFFALPFQFDPRAGGNIMGELAERIARRTTKYFLKHLTKEGYTGGIFDKRFDPQNRNNFIVTHSDNYVLKIDKYPNLVILKKSGRGKYGYENIKELDGLFDYRYKDIRHILVLESKLYKINVDCGDLVNNLFKPLSQFFPKAKFSYILFSDKESIYIKKYFQKQRRLKHLPIHIAETLNKKGIG